MNLREMLAPLSGVHIHSDSQSRGGDPLHHLVSGLGPWSPKETYCRDGMRGPGWKVHWLLSLHKDELMKMKMRSSTAAEKCRMLGRVEAKLSE